MPSTHLILCHPLLLPSVFPSIRVFSNESAVCIRWLKYWSFSISPCNEYSGLISFRIDWLYLLAVQEIFESLLQHHSSNTSIILCSAFFKVQLSHPYMTTGKPIALTRQTFVRKVMSLVRNTLSRAAFVAQLVKNLPAMWETWVGKIPWRRERLPTPVFWPREFHRLYSPWGRKESGMTERLSLQYNFS